MSITLRPAIENDLPLIMAWRSSPLVYQGFFTQTAPLTWEEHIRWQKSRNRDWRTFIIVYNDRDVGVVNIGQLDHWSPEIGYLIGEVSLWGKGIATQAVKQAMEWIKDYGKGYCHTTVLVKNKASLRVLEKLGFTIQGDAREGEVWLTKKL